MGAREDFNQALRDGNFFAAARAWAPAALVRDPGVEAFESKLAASLEERQYVIGESLTVAGGEYTYLGVSGKDGARLAYAPSEGSLDAISYVADHDALIAHLEHIGASSRDSEAVVAFFAMSERVAHEQSRHIENGTAQQEPAEISPAVPKPAATEKELSPEDALRELVGQHGDSEDLAEAVVQLAKQDFKSSRVHVGTIASLGHAPYMHDQKNNRNFYVSLVGPDQQEEAIWGKELEPALAAEGLGAGDIVVLSHQGSKTVTVQVPERDGSGAPTGKMIDAPAQRNSWKAVPLEQLIEMAVKQLSLQPPAVQQPAPVAEFKKRLQNANWFYDSIEDPAERANGQQSLGQLREDFKALMIEYPAEAAEVWRAEAPVEYQPELSDLLAQLENAAPDLIKSHKKRDLKDAPSAEDKTEQLGHDVIQAAPAASVVDTPDKEEDAIRPIVLDQSDEKLEKRSVDAISRFGADVVDTISPAASKKMDQESASAEQGADATSPQTLLNGRFVLRDQGQYFRVADGVESTRVALVDEVNKIRFVDKQMDAFQAAIELAKHKQWDAILVTGSEKFRAEAWHHARMAGLEVVGYEPTEKDLSTLKSAQEGRVKAGLGNGESGLAANPVDVDKSQSLKSANDYAIGAGYGVSEPKVENGRHVGKIIHETDKHIVQDVGRKVAVVHDKESFDRQTLRSAMDKGKPLKVQYNGGRAAVEGSKDRSQARER